MELVAAILSRLVKVVGHEDAELENLMREMREQVALPDTDAKQVNSRLDAFESEALCQLSDLRADVDKRLPQVRSDAPEALDINVFKGDVDGLKHLLSTNKDEVRDVRRIVLKCERDMENFTSAADSMNIDLDELRARVDATHSIITSRQRAEASLTGEVSTLRLDLSDVQDTLKNHDSWMEDVSSTLRQMAEKVDNTSRDNGLLKKTQMECLNRKVEDALWKSRNEDVDSAIDSLREMVTSFRLETDSARQKLDRQVVAMQSELAAAERNLTETSCSLTKNIAQSSTEINARIDAALRDIANFNESTNIAQNSIHDCFNEVAAARGDFDNSLCETETRLKSDIRQKLFETLDKIGLVDSQAEERFNEASRRLGALDLRMSGLQGGLGEGKRDIRSLREEVGSLAAKTVTNNTSINQVQDLSNQLEIQYKASEEHQHAQLREVYELLDQKVDEKAYGNLDHYLASLTKGVVKFAQVIGVFPGPRFDDDSPGEEVDCFDLMGWEECAENMSYRIDKAWRQRCSQRFRNIFDMISKKADQSVLRLIQISQQHIESQLERLKEERELWKEVVDRRTKSDFDAPNSDPCRTLHDTRTPERGRINESRFSPLSKRITRPISSLG